MNPFHFVVAVVSFVLCSAAPKPTVIDIEAPTMPLIAATLYFPFGSATEKLGERGVTDIVTEWIEQGTTQKSAEQIGDVFLATGARFVSRVDISYTIATIEAPEDYFLQAWAQMLEILKTPKLAESDLKDTIKSKMAAKQARLTNVLGIVKELTYSGLYSGSNEESLPVGISSDIDNLDFKKASAFYSNSFAKGPSALFVVKHMPRSIRKTIEESLKDWGQPGLKASNSRRSTISGTSVILVDRPGSTQTYFGFAKPAPVYGQNDRRYIALATQMLGGNGEAGDNPLFQELRSKQGLTYHASLQTWQRPDRDALIGITFGANENVQKLLGGYFSIWDKFIATPTKSITNLRNAERQVLCREGRDQSTIYDAMLYQIELFAAGQVKMAETQALDLNRYAAVVKKYLDRSDIFLLVFGDAKVIRDQVLKVLGPMSKLAIVPETADWSDINAAVVTLNEKK